MSRVVDLSHVVEAGISMFPGHPQPEVEEFLSRDASRANYAPGTSFVIHRYRFVGNTGTYLDSPFHRFADGQDLSQLPLAATVDLPGVVVDASVEVSGGRPDVGPTALTRLGVDLAGQAVLILTGWEERWSTPAYLENKPFLSASGAEMLAESGAALVGIDNWNIDDVADPDRPAHSILLRAGIPIVENLRGLANLIDLKFQFFAAPLPFRHGSAIPVRAFALVDEV